MIIGFRKPIEKEYSGNLKFNEVNVNVTLFIDRNKDAHAIGLSCCFILGFATISCDVSKNTRLVRSQ